MDTQLQGGAKGGPGTMTPQKLRMYFAPNSQYFIQSPKREGEIKTIRGDHSTPKGRKSRPKADSGGGVLGEGAASPLDPHQLGGLRERCKLPSGIRGGRKRIWCILRRHRALLAEE